MRRLLPGLIDDVLLPVLLAWLLAATGVLPFAEGVVFLPASEVFSHIIRRYAPMTRNAARIAGPVLGPVPALFLVRLLFPGGSLHELGRMALNYLIFLIYAALMAFLLPAIEALVGAAPRYDPD